MLECLDEKKTHNSTDEGREPKPEEGFLLEPPKLAELGELEVVVNLLPGEEGITTFLDRRHICTDPLSVFFCFWRISLGLHKYLSIVTFIFVKSQNSYFLFVIHDIFQTSLCNAAFSQLQNVKFEMFTDFHSIQRYAISAKVLGYNLNQNLLELNL